MASQLLTKYRTLPSLELQNIESTSTCNGRWKTLLKDIQD